MRRFSWSVFAATALVALATRGAVAQNLFANPSFEDPVLADGPPFVGSWEAFSGGGGATSANSNISPRTGAQDLSLAIINSNNNFAGTFQDIPGLTPGQSVVFSVWHKAASLPLDLDAEVRIEWRNSVSNTEISRTPNLVPTALITTDYTLVSLPAVVPAGVDTARCVYAIQTFTGGPANTGNVYLDDASFRVVPEPASLALVAVGGLALHGTRRRRS